MRKSVPKNIDQSVRASCAAAQNPCFDRIGHLACSFFLKSSPSASNSCLEMMLQIARNRTVSSRASCGWWTLIQSCNVKAIQDAMPQMRAAEYRRIIDCRSMRNPEHVVDQAIGEKTLWPSSLAP